MRNAWKELSLRALPRIASHTSRTELPTLKVSFPESPNTTFLPPFLGRNLVSPNPPIRWFSSDPSGSDKIKAELESLDISFNQETTDLVLQDLRSKLSAPENGNFRLDSKAYNQMLETLGNNRRSEEFWRVVEIMRKKGFGIAKSTYLAVSKIFEEAKMKKDVNLLKEAYTLVSGRSDTGRMCSELCKILLENEPADVLQEKLNNTDVSLSSELVVAVLESISQHPEKALLFLEWVEIKAPFKIDRGVYNVLAGILGRADSINEFQKLLQTMRNRGYELEKAMYIKVLHRFLQTKMIPAAVDLYEFAMGGSEKPSPQDFLFLLKKIVVSKDLDFNLITRLVRIFVDCGNTIRRSVFAGIIKSLRSVGRLGVCDKVLNAMEEGGFAPDSYVHDQVVIGLCDAGRLDEALKYMVDIENEGYILDSKTWTYLVEKHFTAGEEQALACLKVMIERRGAEKVGCAFDVLIKGYCHKNKVKSAHKILKEMVTKNNVQPWHSTYKFLIEKLIEQKCIAEASSLLELMKSHGFPPYIEPFIRHMSKSGTVDDALGFLKAMTVKEFPSRTVFLRVFNVLLKAGRHEVAHAILSKSPGCVRNHADVLDLFYSMKPKEASAVVA